MEQFLRKFMSEECYYQINPLWSVERQRIGKALKIIGHSGVPFRSLLWHVSCVTPIKTSGGFEVEIHLYRLKPSFLTRGTVKTIREAQCWNISNVLWKLVVLIFPLTFIFINSLVINFGTFQLKMEGDDMRVTLEFMHLKAWFLQLICWVRK